MVFKATFNNISVILKRFMKSVNCSTPGHRSITCSKTSNIPYNLIFTTKFYDSLILITIISCDYLNFSLSNEYVGDVQTRLSSITNFSPGGSANQIAVFVSN